MHDCTIGETLKTGAILCSKQDKLFFIKITLMKKYPHNFKRHVIYVVFKYLYYIIILIDWHIYVAH